MPPSLFAALGLGLRALLREPWLLAVGMLVALVRRAALWPAWTVAWVVLLRAAVLAAPRRPFDLAAPVQGALAALVAPRFVALVLGLALAGLAVGAALRVTFVAGALPTLGGAMAGAPGPRFAPGVAYGFPRVLAASALGLLLEASGGLFGATLALAALRVTAHAAERGGSPLLAAAVASALTVAIAVPLALSAVADAGVARAAVRGEGPARAIASSGARFLARPGTFLIAALAFGLAALLGPGLVSGAGRIATGFAYGVSPLVLVGPRLMLATFAATVAAAIDLVWLGTVTALACGDDDR
ncbi:MAG TPA: hypothetical protein VF912_12995 [Anaeromyxobacter sp.]